MAKGKHPVPFRTRKLSPSAPMVLRGGPRGRVGRRRTYFRWGRPRAGGGPNAFLRVRRFVPAYLCGTVVFGTQWSEGQPGGRSWQGSVARRGRAPGLGGAGLPDRRRATPGPAVLLSDAKAVGQVLLRAHRVRDKPPGVAAPR